MDIVGRVDDRSAVGRINETWEETKNQRKLRKVTFTRGHGFFLRQISCMRRKTSEQGK